MMMNQHIFEHLVVPVMNNIVGTFKSGQLQSKAALSNAQETCGKIGSFLSPAQQYCL